MEHTLPLETVAPFLGTLLADRTAGRNIVYACGEPDLFGREITPQDILSQRDSVMPRFAKDSHRKKSRQRSRAEVFTPSWICNMMNNLADSRWFGYGDAFNTEDKDGHTWEPSPAPVRFPEGKTWQGYVLSDRLEIACGEAPYLVSRYDAVTGKSIPVPERIGLLDRKLRVTGENAKNREEWLRYAGLSLQSTYGFEYQGDSLFLARCNALLTVAEHFWDAFHDTIPPEIMGQFAFTVSWNIWQMDGLSLCIPDRRFSFSLYQKAEDKEKFLEDFVPCRIFDWKEKKELLFRTLAG